MKAESDVSAIRLSHLRCFDEKDRRLYPKLREALSKQWNLECRLIVLNANGLGKAEKRDELVLFLIDFEIKVRVVTETRLLNRGLRYYGRFILRRGYKIGATQRRDTGGEKIRGGVLILVRFDVPVRPLPGAVLPRPPVDACALLAYPIE